MANSNHHKQASILSRAGNKQPQYIFAFCCKAGTWKNRGNMSWESGMCTKNLEIGERSEASGEPKRYSSREYCAGKGIKSKRRRGQMNSQEKGIGTTRMLCRVAFYIALLPQPSLPRTPKHVSYAKHHHTARQHSWHLR